MARTNSRRSLSDAVVEVVADAKDVDPSELEPPLATVIDTDALNTLFVSTNGATGCIVFEYSGCEVTVGSDHTVEARKQTDTEQRTKHRMTL